MALDTEAADFRRQAEARGLVLRTPDEAEARFVFDLKAGTIATSPHPRIVRELRDLAESVYGLDRGEARELAKLVARRAALEDEDAITVVVWMSAAKAHANAPGEYRPGEWVSLADWIEDQFLLEDAIARMDEGVPI